VTTETWTDDETNAFFTMIAEKIRNGEKVTITPVDVKTRSWTVEYDGILIIDKPRHQGIIRKIAGGEKA